MKVAGAMAMLSDVYYPVADVLSWVTNDPTYDQVAAIKSTIKQSNRGCLAGNHAKRKYPKRNAKGCIGKLVFCNTKALPEIIN